VAIINIFPGDSWTTKFNTSAVGDTINIKTGVHREQTGSPKANQIVLFEKGAVANGSRVFSSWTVAGATWYTTGVSRSVQQVETIGAFTPSQPGYRAAWNIDVYIDNVPQVHVTTEAAVTSGTFWYNPSNSRVYIGINPSGKVVEVSYTVFCLNSGEDGITIKGGLVEKYACQRQNAALDFEQGTNTLIENVTVQLCHWKGAAANQGSRFINCRFLRMGQMGFGGTGNILVQGCETAYNNYAKFEENFEAGGCKIGNSFQAVLRSNWAHHNNGPALWLDINNREYIVEHNVCNDNSRHGIYIEISFYGIVRNNWCGMNAPDGTGDVLSPGALAAQIRVESSMDVEVYDNICVVPAQHDGLRTAGIGVTNTARNSSSVWSSTYGAWLSKRNVVRDNDIYYMGDGESGMRAWTDTSAFYTNSPTGPYNNRWFGNRYHRLGGFTANYFQWGNTSGSTLRVPLSTWQGYGFDSTASGSTVDTAVTSSTDDIPPVTVRGSMEYRDRILSTLPTNLIRYYPLDDTSGVTVKDQSKYQVNAVGANLLLNQSGIGDGRRSIDFTRDNGGTLGSYINLLGSSFNTDFDPNEFTVHFWTKLTTASASDTTTHRFAYIEGNNVWLQMQKIYSGSTPKWRMALDLNGVNVATYSDNNPTADWTRWTMARSQKGADGLTTGTDGYLKIYKDGVLVSNTVNSAFVSSNTFTKALLASFSATTSSGSDCNLQHVAIWNRALTDAEVINLQDINDAPKVISIAKQFYSEGQTISLSIQASDNNLVNTLSYTSDNLPTGLVISAATGVITGTLTNATSGYWTSTIRVSDNGSPVRMTPLALEWVVADANIIQLTGIASGEAFGALTVTTGNVSIAPTGIASGEAFGTLTVTTGNVSIAPTGIASGEAFGTLTVTTGNVNIAPTGIASGEAFGALTVTTGNVNIAPTGIASGEAFGTLVVSRSISVTGIASGEAFGALAVTTGNVNIAPTGIASGEAFGTAIFNAGLVQIAPSGIASGEAFGALTVTTGNVDIAPTGIASGEAFGAVTVNTVTTVTVTGIPSAEAFGTLIITTGNVDIAPTGIASDEAFGIVTVTTGAANIALTGIASGEAFGNAVIATADITITLAGIPSGEAFGNAAITTGNVDIAPTGIPSDEAFGDAAFTTGNVNIAPSGIASGEAFGHMLVDYEGVDLFPDGIPSGEAFGALVVTTGNVNIAPIGIPSGESFGLFTVNAPGRKGITVTSEVLTHRAAVVLTPIQAAASFDSGDLLTLQATFTVNGINVDPVQVNFYTMNPAGVVAVYVYGTHRTVRKLSTGRYQIALALAAEGDWHWRWQGVGDCTAVIDGRVYVRDGVF